MKLAMATQPHNAIKSEFGQQNGRRRDAHTEPRLDAFEPKNMKELRAALVQWKKGNTDGTDLHHWFTEIKTAEHQRAFLDRLPLLGCCREGELYTEHVCEFACNWTSADWARELDYKREDDGYSYEFCTMCTGRSE